MIFYVILKDLVLKKFVLLFFFSVNHMDIFGILDPDPHENFMRIRNTAEN